MARPNAINAGAAAGIRFNWLTANAAHSAAVVEMSRSALRAWFSPKDEFHGFFARGSASILIGSGRNVQHYSIRNYTCASTMSKRTSHRNSEEGELPPVPTDVRFSLQGLLVTTGVVAVAAAGLGSVFRRVAPDLRPAVLTSWSLCLALTSGLLAFHAFRRWRLERAAGRVIASLMPRGTFGHTSRPWMVTVAQEELA